MRLQPLRDSTPKRDTRSDLTIQDLRRRRARRKPFVSLALLAIILAIWYKYWIPPVISWLWHARYGTSVGWHGRSIAVPKGWYARWHDGQPELRHLAVPMEQNATVTISNTKSTYDEFSHHASDVAQKNGFALQTIRTYVHAGNTAFCLQGFNGAGMNDLCAFSNADFALLYRGVPAPESDLDAIMRSVLQ